MGAIIKNQFRTFLRNPGSIFMFVFPLVMIVTLISVENVLDIPQSAKQAGLLVIYANLIVIGVMSVINSSFGSNFMELRTSSLIKRLGTTQVTKSQLLTGYVL